MGKSKEKGAAKETTIYQVTAGTVRVKKGASEKAAEISTVSTGQYFVVSAEKSPSWQKVDGGGNDGWVDVAADEATVEKCDTLQVRCAVCTSDVSWKDWAGHKKSKGHSKQFAYNLYDPNAVASIGAANLIIEKAALLADPELLAVLKPNVALPAENCGRWGGPRPNNKKDKNEKPRMPSDGEAVPTEAELAWAAKAEARRKQLTEASGGYNTGDVPVAMTSYPGSVEPFSAGRGRPLTPPKPGPA